MSDLPVLSASKLRTFGSCPRRYYYQYVERLPQEQSTSAILGSAVHKTIEMVYKKQVEPVSFFTKHFYDELQRHNLDPDRAQMSDGVKMVADYPYDLTVPTQLEYEFWLPFPDKESPLCIIHGFLDQIFDWGFIDLKTGRRKPTQEQLDNDIQFILYAWAYWQTFGKPPAYCMWHHLRTQKRMNAFVLDKVPVATAAVKDLLNTRDFGVYDTVRAFHCKWCPFREPCFSSDEEA